MARNKQKLINYHGTVKVNLTKENLNLGEIAVIHNENNPELAIRVSGETKDELAYFIDAKAVSGQIHTVNTELQGEISTEQTERKDADTALDTRIKALEDMTETVNGALQGIEVSGGTYVKLGVTEKGPDHKQTITITDTITPITSATGETKGLAEASDVKTYVDGKVEGLKGTIDSYKINNYTLGSEPITINGGDITLTGYDKGSDSNDVTAEDTVNTAIGKLANKLDTIADGCVTSIGGKKGAITLKAESQTNGDINLAISQGNEMSASIVGLGSAAFTNSDAYATSAQGTKADTALQNITANGDTYITLTAAEKTGNTQNITAAVKTQSVASADGKNMGLAEASDVKTYVDTQINDKIAAADAMIYKGVINAETGLPTTYKTGWTYKVGTAGEYVGQQCEVGDMIIALVDKDEAVEKVVAEDWSVIQTNIDGAVSGPVNATDAHVAVFDSTTGKVIKDGGKTIAEIESSASNSAIIAIKGDAATYDTLGKVEDKLETIDNTITNITVAAGDGINVADKGGKKVSIKLDPAGEGKFLTVGTEGLKLSGVQSAIDAVEITTVNATGIEGVSGSVSGNTLTLDFTNMVIDCGEF